MFIDDNPNNAALGQEGHVKAERLNVHDLHCPTDGGPRCSLRISRNNGPPDGGRSRSPRICRNLALLTEGVAAHIAFLETWSS